MPTTLLDHWYDILRSAFPQAGEGETWRAVAMLLVTLYQDLPRGAVDGPPRL